MGYRSADSYLQKTDPDSAHHSGGVHDADGNYVHVTSVVSVPDRDIFRVSDADIPPDIVKAAFSQD